MNQEQARALGESAATASKEEWKCIPGLEGRYEASNLGRIRNAITGRVRATPCDRKGYPRVVLTQNGKPTSWAVHRAVLAAFLPRIDWRDMHVNHKDGNTKNNLIDNIEWCTASENRLHSYRVLKTRNPMSGRFGAKNHNARAVVGTCISTGEVHRYESISMAAKDGFDPKQVSACVNGTQKSHRGWVFSGAPGASIYTRGG